MRTFIANLWGKHYTLAVEENEYLYGGLAVQLYDVTDDERFATVSIFVPEASLEPGEFVFKTYSENEGFLEAMLAARIVEKTGRTVQVGWGGPQPICRLK
jgi:hypothetical protein